MSRNRSVKHTTHTHKAHTHTHTQAHKQAHKHTHAHTHTQSSCTVTSLTEMEEQEGKTWNVCGRSYKRTEEFWGRTSKIGIQKVTGEPSASFLLVMTFSYTLHDGTINSFCGEFLFVLVYEGSTSCMPLCWFIWGVSLTCPVLDYMWSFSYSYTPHAGFFLWGVCLIRSMLASLSREFLLYKTRNKKCKCEQKCT